MDDRSYEAMQPQEITSADETQYLHDHNDDADDFTAVILHNETNDRSDVSKQVPHNSAKEEASRNRQSVALAASDLSEVPVKYDLRQEDVDCLKNHLQGSQQEALATVIAQANLINSPMVRVPSSFTRLPATVNADVAEPDPNEITGSKFLSESNTVKIPVDDYTWRKYGQKQVKKPQGSRSYYKCTYNACDAKKLEFCDQFNSILKVVYKGQHKHDPPKRVISSSQKSLKRKSISAIGLKERQSSNAGIEVLQIDSSEIKQRLKRDDSETVLKHSIKSKFIVHAAADMAISADGYRWRKYGQKMVKGNPHPRNYYKCTCAGCAVKKHIEKVVDDSSQVIITYNGVHNHDTLVPKKGQGPPSGLIIATASKNILQFKKTGFSSTTEAPKTKKSAPTLLSVGFEIKHR